MFRDRTNLYLSYRRTIPRAEEPDDRFESFAEEEALIGRRRNKYRDNGNSIEMQTIAPSIFDIAKGIDDNLDYVKTKTPELNGLYKKLLITSSSDKPDIEKRIENLNYDITKRFENSYVLIKKFQFLQTNHQRLKLNYTATELSMIENFKKNYALKIQDSSLVFRNLQNNYIKFLRDDDYEDFNESKGLLSLSNAGNSALLEEEETRNIENYSKQVIQETQMQIQTQTSNDHLLQQREREISKLAMGILEISTIFKEMESLVVEQGTLLDRIDYNLTSTVQDLKASNQELLKAKGYQKRTTKCKLIFLLSLIVFALFLVVIIRPAGTTKADEKPATDSPKTPPEANPPQSNNPDSRPVLDKPEAQDDIGEHVKRIEYIHRI